jgi:hypothetical protein
MRPPFPALLALAAALAGCAAKPAAHRPRPGLPTGISTTEVDPVRLHNQLLLFADEFSGDVAGTMSDIAADSRNRVIWEQTLLFKTRIIPLIYLTARQDDPREAFLDMWVLVARMRHYLTAGEGGKRFGAQQPQAAAMAQEVEARFLAMGDGFYTRAVLDDLKDEVESIVTRNPITEIAGVTALHAADAAAPKEKGALGGILGIPLLPVSGVSDIKSAAGSIDSATRAFESFTTVTQLMPEQIRWQAELLLLEFDALESVVKLRADLDRLSDSVEAIAATAAALPETLRRELDLALAGADPQLQRVQAIVADAEKAMAQGRDVSQTLARAAEAWDQTAQSVNQVLATYKEIQGPETPPDPSAGPQPSGLEELATAAERTRGAAEELRALLAELESGRLDNALARTTLSVDGLVDRITWRAIMIAAAAAVIFAICRVAVSRLSGARVAGRNPDR